MSIQHTIAKSTLLLALLPTFPAMAQQTPVCDSQQAKSLALEILARNNSRASSNADVRMLSAIIGRDVASPFISLVNVKVVKFDKESGFRACVATAKRADDRTSNIGYTIMWRNKANGLFAVDIKDYDAVFDAYASGELKARREAEKVLEEKAYEERELAKEKAKEQAQKQAEIEREDRHKISSLRKVKETLSKLAGKYVKERDNEITLSVTPISETRFQYKFSRFNEAQRLVDSLSGEFNLDPNKMYSEIFSNYLPSTLISNEGCSMTLNLSSNEIRAVKSDLLERVKINQACKKDWIFVMGFADYERTVETEK